jgi:peroxiredoxin
MQESKTMSVDEALHLMRKPAALAQLHGKKVVVAVYPRGTGMGATPHVATLTVEYAEYLMFQLQRAIAEAKAVG